MTKTFVYEKPYYGIEVVLVGWLCVAVVLVCGYSLATSSFIPYGLAIVFGVAALYQIWNTFVSLSNPQKVTVDEEGDKIVFSGFGREHAYRLSTLKTFLVRPFPSSGKTYIRVGDSSVLKGRYWVPTKMFSDGKELFDYLVDLEYKIHPDTLKARARRVNTEYLENKDKIEAIRAQEKREKREKARARLSLGKKSKNASAADDQKE